MLGIRVETGNNPSVLNISCYAERSKEVAIQLLK